MRKLGLIAVGLVLSSGLAAAITVDSVQAPDEVEAGSDFSVNVAASDESEVSALILEVDGERREEYFCPTDVFPAERRTCSNDFAVSIDSESDLTAIAEDENGNEASREIQISTEDGSGADFGDDISVSIDRAPSGTITRDGTYDVSVSVDADSGGLLGQKITLKEENGGYFERSGECSPPSSRPTATVFSCSKSFNYRPERTGEVDLVAEASTSTGTEGYDSRSLIVEETGLGEVADITVLEPDSEEENPVPLKISLDLDPEEYSCFWDDDISEVVDTGNRLSRSGDRFSDSSNFDSGQTVYFQCERTADGELTDRRQATFTLQQTVQEPTADLEVAPRTGQEGDTFTFDASESSRADEFRFDFDGDGDIDRTTDNQIVTETINDPGQNIRAEVTVFNDAGSETDADFYTVEESQEPPQAELIVTPQVGEEGESFTFDASGSIRADSFEFDFDGDGIIEETTSSDIVTRQVDDAGQNIRAEVTASNDAGEDADSDFYTVERDQRVPEAELDVRPGVGDSGDAFTFDASNSERGQTFRYDFDGDGIIEETTSSDTVTRVIDRTGNFQASVDVSNSAGSRQAFDGYVVGERPDPVAEITVLSPLEGERVNPPVQAQIQLSQDGSRYECFYDDDPVAVVESGRDADEDSGSLSGSENRFEATVPGSDLQEGDARLFFQCERGDGERTGTKSVSFTVEEEGSAPTAQFSVSNPSPDVNEQIQFDARPSSDPDGDIVNYDFNFGDGFTASGIQTTHSYTEPGVYTVRLLVVDSEGRTSTTTRTVNVQNLSPPPRGDSPPSAGFTFAPQIPRAGDTLRLRSTASDPDNDIDFRNWRIETPDGREFDFENGVQASYRAEESGTYTVTHTVRDSNDNSDSATRDIIVSEPENSEPSPVPPPPRDDSPPEADFTFTPQNPQAGTEVIFQSTATDPDNDIDFRNWRINTPKGREFDFSSGTTAEYTPRDPGNYRISHRVRDSGDRTDTTTRLIHVGETGADQQCGIDRGSVSRLDLDPEEVSEGEESDVTVEVDNDGADQDARVEFVSFDFSTGDSETIDTVEHEVEENEEEVFETEVEVDADSRIIAEVFTEGDGCGDRFITSTSEILEFSGQQEEDGIVRVSAFTNLGTGVNAFVTLTGPEDRAVNIGGDGERSLTVEPGSYEATARFSGNFRRRNIDVESGEVRPVTFSFPSETTAQTETAAGLTARLESREVDAGQRVKVRGDIRGTSGSQTVQLYSEGDRVSSTSSARDGSYTVSFVPNRVGELSLSVRAGGESAERRVRVLPTSSVLSVEAPQQVFEGDQFQVCGRVETQEQAEVSLLRDGEELASRSGSGEVCFDTTAQDIGDTEYTVRSSTYGNGDQRSTTVEVLEDQAEASMSTDQVATVETESGTVRVSVYNNNDEKQTYEADLTGIPDTWAEITEKEIVLQPGEERDIYFYTTPREEGEFNPQVQVTEGGRTVFEEGISLEVGGHKTQKQVSGGGLFDFVLSSLTLA